MDEIEIVIENIPTRFIKTVKYGNLNYDEVKNTIRIILWDNDDDDEHSIREFNKTIIDWLEDNDTVLKFTGSGQAHKFKMRFSLHGPSNLEILYDKITEHERIMDKLIGE